MGQLMNRERLLRVLRTLNLPKGDYVVFGGACLVIHGIRDGDDLDIFVAKKLYNKLVDRGWHEQWPREGDPPLLEAIVERIAVHAFHDWQKRDKWQPNVKKLIKEAEIIEGFPFVPLHLMYDWKSLGHRLKDRQDVTLIKQYWEINQA